VLGIALASMVVYALRGRKRDADQEGKGAQLFLGFGDFLLHWFMWAIDPTVRISLRLGLTPDFYNFAGLFLGVLTGVLLARGNLEAGGWMIALGGIADILDGRIARATGRVTKGGAFFDSVMDRYAEIVVFGGLTVFYRNSWAIYVVMLASLGSVMVSYTRARGEALGVQVNIGTMQRPERLFYLGIISAFAPIVETLLGHGNLPPFVPVVVALGLLGVSANVTAVRRITHTLELLDGRLKQAEKAAPAQEQTPILPLRSHRAAK
jgi:phosphatidylinositol phosphate synthase